MHNFVIRFLADYHYKNNGIDMTIPAGEEVAVSITAGTETSCLMTIGGDFYPHLTFCVDCSLFEIVAEITITVSSAIMKKPSLSALLINFISVTRGNYPSSDYTLDFVERVFLTTPTDSLLISFENQKNIDSVKEELRRCVYLYGGGTRAWSLLPKESSREDSLSRISSPPSF